MIRSTWWLLAACTPDKLETRELPPTDGSSDPSTSESTGPGDTVSPPEPTETDPCDLDVPDPGPPAFPSTLGTLTVTVRTGDAAATNGTDDDTIELCLTEDRCFPLAQGKGTQLRAGATGVWMFEDVGSSAPWWTGSSCG